MEVVGVFHSVRGNLAAAFAVPASVRKKDCISVVEKEFAVPGDAFTVVGDSMHQHHCIAIELVRMDIPALHFRSIVGADARVLELCSVLFVRDCRKLMGMPQWKPAEMEATLAQKNTSQYAEQEITPERNQQLMHRSFHLPWPRCFHIKRRWKRFGITSQESRIA